MRCERHTFHLNIKLWDDFFLLPTPNSVLLLVLLKLMGGRDVIKGYEDLMSLKKKKILCKENKFNFSITVYIEQIINNKITKNQFYNQQLSSKSTEVWVE